MNAAADEEPEPEVVAEKESDDKNNFFYGQQNGRWVCKRATRPR
jgi:hypothetical protein